MQLAIEERVDTLEIVLGEFIVSTNKAFLRMERANETLNNAAYFLSKSTRMEATPLPRQTSWKAYIMHFRLGQG